LGSGISQQGITAMSTKPLHQVNPMPRGATIAILAISAAAIGFLLWLIYVREAPAEFARQFTFLPALNAVLNGLSATALSVGYYFIRNKNPQAHRNSMMLAFGFSSLFLISYIAHHALHGDTHYPGHGVLRGFYLSILASHIILSVVALPLVLVTFFLSLTRRFPAHRKVARYTFPIWLYVSITGVAVFLMLRAAI
jgi:putative membrane protein